MAALTKGRAGHEMTEIGFLLDAGAIAFSDVYNVSTDTKALARALTYAIMRPWRQVTDNIEYNRGILLDAVAQGIINRRLESRARAGGSYLYAGVETDKTSRSADATYVMLAPIDNQWQPALADVRGVIADALAHAPSQEEIDRELAENDVIYANMVEQSRIQAGSKLADDVVNAVDIREAVASPETVLDVFRSMRARYTPEALHERTKAMFQGDVIRSILLTPQAGEATPEQLRAALLVGLLSLFFQKTSTGRALRAVADDHQAAQSIGIPLNRIWVIVWCVAGVVALVAGMIWGSKLGVQFSLTTVALRALPVVILGGLTSVPGAIIGGLIIGVGEKLSEVYLGPFVGGGIEIWFAYVLALGFLLFRPQGLFGEKIIDRV